ncbi:TniQ family protein [Sulfitobacter geojensis]|uniref:TniQ family protein n=1 Tax=Sulfitobacter geojensis TaxID=1342299 RepID=UPI0024926B68|nr:TniQ family protein [Sulfitobacter geojensis]
MSILVQPDRSESLEGYLRRFAEAEMWPDVSDFLGAFGLRYGRPLIEEAEEAERILELPKGTLKDILPSAAPTVPTRNWRFERHHSAPVCPDCISEGKPHHHSWRHSFVTACSDHGLRLVDECPMCGENFMPGRGGYDSCHCGCPLDRLPRNQALEAEVALSALISGDMHPARSALPPALAFRTPIDIGEFVYFLASVEIETETGKQGKTPLPKNLAEASAFLEPVFSTFCEWPTTFERSVSARLSNSVAATAPMRLGKWYQRLNAFNGQAYNDFRATLRQVVQREFDGAYAGGTNSPSDKWDWVSAAEAAKILHIRAERLVDAVAKQRIPGRKYASGFGHRHTMIHRDTVANIVQDRQRFIDKTAARELLGISRKQYDLLAEAGLTAHFILETLPPLVDGQHDSVAVKRFIADIASTAAEVEGTTVALKDLNLRFTTDAGALKEVFCRISNGRLRPAMGSTDGRFAEFRFSRKEVDTIIADVRHGPGLTIQQVAELTGWKDQCVAQWCKQGLIQHEEFPHAGKVGRIIRQEDLCSFQMEYVPVSTLACQLGTSARHLMTKLSDIGIETIGAFRDGTAWRGHLLKLSDLASTRKATQ